MRLLFRAMQMIFMLLVQGANRIDKDKEYDRRKRLVHVAERPGDRNQRKMNQIRIERSTTDRTDDRDAENFAEPAFGSRYANDKSAVDHYGHRVMTNEIPGDGIRFHRKEAYIQNNKKENLQNAGEVILLQKVECTRAVQPEENHAKEVFENAHQREHVKILVTQIVVRKISEQRKFPKESRMFKENTPSNSRQKYKTAQNPERFLVRNLRQLTRTERRNRIANEECGERPARFIQFHSLLRKERPRQSQVHN